MELHSHHGTAMALAGTVALPSPYPAHGAVSLVIAGDGDHPEVLVRIVQVVTPRRIITRFVRPEDIRAIQGRPEGGIGDGPESWPIVGIRELRTELDRRIRGLQAGSGAGPAGEAAWYPAAIVYVPEAAPVLHRDEVGVTAAVSAEEVAFVAHGSHCCAGGRVAEPEGSAGVAPEPLDGAPARPYGLAMGPSLVAGRLAGEERW